MASSMILPTDLINRIKARGVKRRMVARWIRDLIARELATDVVIEPKKEEEQPKAATPEPPKETTDIGVGDMDVL